MPPVTCPGSSAVAKVHSNNCAILLPAIACPQVKRTFTWHIGRHQAWVRLTGVHGQLLHEARLVSSPKIQATTNTRWTVGCERSSHACSVSQLTFFPCIQCEPAEFFPRLQCVQADLLPMPSVSAAWGVHFVIFSPCIETGWAEACTLSYSRPVSRQAELGHALCHILALYRDRLCWGIHFVLYSSCIETDCTEASTFSSSYPRPTSKRVKSSAFVLLPSFSHTCIRKHVHAKITILMLFTFVDLMGTKQIQNDMKWRVGGMKIHILQTDMRS